MPLPWFYNAPKGRIEMYIVSRKAQIVHLKDREFSFVAGELLRTEYSYKYSIPEFQTLALQAGFQSQQVWTDAQQLFSLHYLQSTQPDWLEIVCIGGVELGEPELFLLSEQ